MPFLQSSIQAFLQFSPVIYIVVIIQVAFVFLSILQHYRLYHQVRYCLFFYYVVGSHLLTLALFYLHVVPFYLYDLHKRRMQSIQACPDFIINRCHGNPPFSTEYVLFHLHINERQDQLYPRNTRHQGSVDQFLFWSLTVLPVQNPAVPCY